MKKIKKKAGQFIMGGVALGVGSQVLSNVGSTGGTQALSKMSGMLPAMGTAIGGGMLISSLDMLSPKKKKRKH